MIAIKKLNSLSKNSFLADSVIQRVQLVDVTADVKKTVVVSSITISPRKFLQLLMKYYEGTPPRFSCIFCFYWSAQRNEESD